MRTGSSVWLECRHVTPEVAGSSPVRSAIGIKQKKKSLCFAYFNVLRHKVFPKTGSFLMNALKLPSVALCGA